MRYMSFALTTQQIRERTKTVTRRLGWHTLKPGDLVQAVVKGMGLQKGESPEKLAILRVVDVHREPLNMMSLVERYGDQEAVREGFSHLEGWEFVRMFCRNMGVKDTQLVTRIEFRYVPGGATAG